MGGRGSTSVIPKRAPISLKGSEKQVKWASEIRKKLQEGISILDDKRSAGRLYKQLREEGYEITDKKASDISDKVKRAFFQIDDSKWFIEKRSITNYPNWYIDLARAVIDKKRIYKRK